MSIVAVVELRPTTAADLPELHELFLESIGGVYRPHGFEPPSPPLEVFANQQRHILETGTSLVARDGERALGFAAAWARDRDWYLASLFVAAGAQGAGAGAALLDAVWGEGYARRRTLTDAIQPVSNALYGRRGLVPSVPVLVFTGTPRLDGGAAPAAADLAAVDGSAYGFDRAVDHAYWGRFGRRTTWPGAYSYAFPGGAIGPVAGVDPRSAAAALRSELARADGSVVVRIPGSSRALVEVALAAGLRLQPVPGLLLLSEAAPPPVALAIGSFALL